jgi:hypothetical protein
VKSLVLRERFLDSLNYLIYLTGGQMKTDSDFDRHLLFGLCHFVLKSKVKNVS